MFVYVDGKASDGHLNHALLVQLQTLYLLQRILKGHSKLADASTKIVSLTITEGGYNFDQHGAFIEDNPSIQWDIQNSQAPKTVFGLLTAALQLRKRNGQKPFTIMSCDNIQNNGDMCKRMLLSFVKLVDEICRMD